MPILGDALFPELPVFLIIVFAAIVGRYMSRKGNDLERRLRDEWGKPIDRWRDLEAIAEYHNAKAEGDGAAAFLDDRTWSDLHLDLVFAEVDRTRSSIGNQLLYHRLRSAPTGDELDRFECLVQYFGKQEEARVGAQLLLSRLSHAAGYRLWGICQEDGVDTHWWYGLFPVLTLGVLGSAVAIPFWPRAVLVLLAIVVVNITLRVKLASRVFHLLGPFKEIGPLLKCAKAVLLDPEVLEIVGASQIEADLRSVESLETTARWASRNSSLENEIVGATWEYLNVLMLLDANAVLFATRTLRRSGPCLMRIIESLGEVDAAISTASLRAGLSDWTIPSFRWRGCPQSTSAGLGGPRAAHRYRRDPRRGASSDARGDV